MSRCSRHPVNQPCAPVSGRERRFSVFVVLKEIDARLASSVSSRLIELIIMPAPTRACLLLSRYASDLQARGNHGIPFIRARNPGSTPEAPTTTTAARSSSFTARNSRFLSRSLCSLPFLRRRMCSLSLLVSLSNARSAGQGAAARANLHRTAGRRATRPGNEGRSTCDEACLAPAALAYPLFLSLSVPFHLF